MLGYFLNSSRLAWNVCVETLSVDLWVVVVFFCKSNMSSEMHFFLLVLCILFLAEKVQIKWLCTDREVKWGVFCHARQQTIVAGMTMLDLTLLADEQEWFGYDVLTVINWGVSWHARQQTLSLVWPCWILLCWMMSGSGLVTMYWQSD